MQYLESTVRDAIYGMNVHIVKPANIYECEIRDNVFIGPFVEIQKGCVIGCGSRIQSHTFICEHVTLGENCFIGHNVTFANDLFRSGVPDPSRENWITITLGNSVTVGSGAAILSPYICSGSVIGAGSVVVKSVKIKGIYAGNPARLIRTLGKVRVKFIRFILANTKSILKMTPGNRFQSQPFRILAPPCPTWRLNPLRKIHRMAKRRILAIIF